MLGDNVSKKLNNASSLLTRNISNLANNLVVGYKFYVFIGPVSLAFNKVSGIEKAYNYQTVQQGGDNDRLYFLSNPIQQSSTIVFEDGGMTISSSEMKTCFNKSAKEVLVLLCTSSGKIKDIIAVHSAVVSKISIDDLDASSSNLAINRIEMEYSGFSRFAFNVV